MREPLFLPMHGHRSWHGRRGKHQGSEGRPLPLTNDASIQIVINLPAHGTLQSMAAKTSSVGLMGLWSQKEAMNSSSEQGPLLPDQTEAECSTTRRTLPPPAVYLDVYGKDHKERIAKAQRFS